jgi:hypothetical protein
MRRPQQLAETADGWVLVLPGWTVTRCYFDPAAFGFLDGGTVEIPNVYIETAFTLHDNEGASRPSPRAPTPGGPCTGGTGSPVR